MRLFKKESTNEYVIPKDLSVSAIGMLNSLLVRSNDELENIDLYSLGNDSRKDVALAFRELRKKKYIIYNSTICFPWFIDCGAVVCNTMVTQL